MSAANEKSKGEEAFSGREIVVSRLLNAPRELVFKTFTDIKHLSQWWGPRGFTTTTQSHDVRVGGAWRYVMHGPDGVDYVNTITYLEIVRPERIVYDHGGEGEHPKDFRSVITFEEQSGKTLLTLRITFDTVEACEATKKFGAVEGGKQTLERLSEILSTLPGSQPDTVIVTTRVINASRERIFKAWTEPQELALWWGPKGFSNTFEQCDVTPGGDWKFVMHGPDGKDYPNGCKFIELNKPERIVIDHIESHYFRIVALFNEESGGTRVIFEMLFETPEECARIKVFAVGCNEEMFDRLEQLVVAR